MTKVLIVVDMQNDFVDGSLGSKEAVRILPQVVKEIRDESYDCVYATLDTHPKEYLKTMEGKNLPVEHCIKDTAGWQLNPVVQQALEKRHAVIIEKPTFGSEQLVEEMKKLQPQEITLVGLCTDICVISNALMLRAALHETPIHVIGEACAGVTPAKHNAALIVMQSCQIDIR
jgi:nicotinamidase-related amidase